MAAAGVHKGVQGTWKAVSAQKHTHHNPGSAFGQSASHSTFFYPRDPLLSQANAFLTFSSRFRLRGRGCDTLLCIQWCSALSADQRQAPGLWQVLVVNVQACSLVCHLRLRISASSHMPWLRLLF